MKNLGKLGLIKFNQVSSMFRSFCSDPVSGQKKKSFVILSDFSSKIQEIGLVLPEHIVKGIFDKLDTDNDGKLKYIDFVNLC